MACLGRPYSFKFLKGCLPQILLGPFLNILSQMRIQGQYCTRHKIFQKYSPSISSIQHCVKCVQIRSFFWSVFPRIRTEYGKIRTRKNSVFGHFSSIQCSGNISEAFNNAVPNSNPSLPNVL